MAQVRSWAGLDVHAAKVLAATMDSESGELVVGRLSGATCEVVEFRVGLPGPTRVAYEAGPTGFGLARALEAAGVGCVVAAPGKIERPASDRVKTDRRDAERGLRLSMIGGLHPVRVPTPEEEALRDLVRAREDVRGDLMRARHRLSKLLLRPDVRFEGGAWTQHHRRWLAGLELAGRGAQVTLHDYVGAIDALLVRRDGLEATIEELVPGSPWAETVARLRCLRGIDTLTAVGLCAEIGDFGRFARAGHVMSFLGLVPSEHSSARAAGRARSPSPAPATAAGCWSKRPGTSAEPRPRARRSSAARPARRPRARDLLAGPAAPAPQLAAPRQRARQAPPDRRGRRRARARRLLLGRRQRRLTPPAHVGQGGGANPSGTTRARTSAVLL